MHVLDANPRQAGYFRIRKNLLARLHGNHGPAPCSAPTSLSVCFDATTILSAAHIP
jgi:hypothetical protein